MHLRDVILALEIFMIDRPSDLTSAPIYQPRRSVLSLRKFALMASVVASLGAAAYESSEPP